MPRRILEFPTSGAANGQQQAIHVWMGQNIPGYNADRWDDTYKHPDRNAWRVTIKDRCISSLPPGIQAQIKNEESDWEPGPPPNP